MRGSHNSPALFFYYRRGTRADFWTVDGLVKADGMTVNVRETHVDGLSP